MTDRSAFRGKVSSSGSVSAGSPITSHGNVTLADNSISTQRTQRVGQELAQAFAIRNHFHRDSAGPKRAAVESDLSAINSLFKARRGNV